MLGLNLGGAWPSLPEMNREIARRRQEEADGLIESGRFEDAYAILCELDEEYPGAAQVRLAQARCLAELGRPQDAIAMCDALVDQYNSNRARALAEAIRAKASYAATRELEDGPSPRRWPAYLLRGTFVVVAIIVVISAVIYRQQIAALDTVAAPTDADVAAASVALEEELRAKAFAPSTEPGRVIPQREWEATNCVT